MSYLDYFFLLILYALPLYIANATPILIHGKTPIDFNKKLFKKPIFGKGKTIIGTISGITAGTLVGVLIIIFIPYSLSLIPNYQLLAFTLSVGAIFGDITKSFFKRRFGINSGEKWVLVDQLDFIIGGLILSTIFIRTPEIWIVLLLLLTTFFIHSGSNYVAYKLKLKKVPW